MKYEEYDYIRGNTALAPGRKRKEDRQEEQQKKRLERQKAARKQKHLVRNILSVSTLAVVLGSISLTMDGIVYKNQAELSKIQESYEDQVSINEALNVEMIKYSSVETIKDTAENQIGMIYADDTNTIKIDMSKDFFPNVEKNEQVKSSFLNKIMSIFS